jgi:hypothetical protein
MALTVQEVWDEWKRLTRFLECSKIAFQRELAIWGGLEVPDLSVVRINTQNGASRFSVTASEHIDTLRDEQLLYVIVLTYSYSLCESYAKVKLGLGEGDRLQGGIESWGETLLRQTNNTWTEVLGARAGLIEVAVALNFIAHGSRVVDQSTINRFSTAGEASPWQLGDTVSLTYDKVEDYRSRLKSLMRLGNQ